MDQDLMVAFSLTLMLCATRCAEIDDCGAGIFSVQPALVSSFPSGTQTFGTRSLAECAIRCAQGIDCRQLYYNTTKDTCSLAQNPITSFVASSAPSDGLLLTASSSIMPPGKTCRIQSCPAGTACRKDCSSTFGGSVCVADGTTCSGETEILNARHYYTSTFEDDRDTGSVHTAYYRKSRSDTALRVQWYATTRSHYHLADACGRYYVTFNGLECTNPGPIDFVDYDISYTNKIRSAEIDGICYGLPVGTTTVDIRVGTCLGRAVSDSYTGWNLGRSMWLSEIKTPTNPASCPSLPVLNTKYVWRQLETGVDPDTLIWSLSYAKAAADTALRIKFVAPARVYAGSGEFCGRWYVTVNGVECSPKVEFILAMLHQSSSRAVDNHKTRTLEGICYGLAAGTYTIAVRVGLCTVVPTGAPDTSTGHIGVSRFIVDEVRIGSKIQAVTISTGQVMKVPFYNLQHYTWYRLNQGTDLGTIATVIYTKWSDTSGLHIHMVGDARVYNNNGCCRWYFAIDGVECTDPGPIAGLSFTEFLVNYHHPLVIDGVCYGLSSGDHTVTYNVGTCPGYGVGDCFTNYESTLNVMVEEVQPEARSTCIDQFNC